MLNMGFKEQIYDIYRYLPPETQVILVSATLPVEVLEMTTKFMTDPIRILAGGLFRTAPDQRSSPSFSSARVYVRNHPKGESRSDLGSSACSQ